MVFYYEQIVVSMYIRILSGQIDYMKENTGRKNLIIKEKYGFLRSDD